MTTAAPARAAPESARGATCPYRGLLPFSVEDAPYFFGRDADREIIGANLIASRLTLLYAPSGVGKTSVLLAGVVHDVNRLARESQIAGVGPEYLPVVVRRWSGDPMAAIDAAIAAAAATLADGAAPESPPGDAHLVDRLRAWSDRTDSTLLLLLDQFEEFVLYHGQTWDPGAPAYELARAMSARDLPANFLLGLREDALASLDRFKGRVPHLFENYLRLDHLDAAAGREAIVGPLEQWNLEHEHDRMDIEPELVDEVLEQVASGRITLGRTGAGAVTSEPGIGIEAPFLQLVMTRLWERERAAGSNRLQLATLSALGGAGELVRTHLDVHMRRITRHQRDVAAAVFHQLVTPSGSKVARSLEDLAAYTRIPAAEIEPVLETLSKGDWRIVRAVSEPGRSDKRTYEVFHDVLAEAILDWRARHEDRRRRARMLRVGLAIGFVAALVALLALLLVASFRDQANKAKRQQMAAVSARLATASGSLLGYDPAGAVSKAAEAVDTESNPEALRALRAALAQADLRGVLRGPRGSVAAVRVSQDGRRVASAGGDGHVRIWTLTKPADPVVLPRDGNRSLSVAFSPDGDRVATAGEGPEVKVWRVADRKLLHTLRVGGRKTLLRWAPRGERLVSFGATGTKVWDLSSRAGRLIRSIGPARDAQWSPGASRFVTGTATEAGRVRIWSRDGRFLGRVRGRGPVRALAFSTDGSRAFVARRNGMVNSSGPRDCRESRLRLSTAAFSQDGRFVALADADGVRVVNTTTCKARFLRITPPALTGTLAFSDDDQTVVAAGADGAARVWDMRTQTLLTTLIGNWGKDKSPPLLVRAAAGGGQIVFAGGDDGVVREWQVAALPVARQWQRAGVLAAAFDGTGRSLLAVTDTGLARADWRGGDGPRSVGHVRGATAAAFSPDARVAAVQTQDGSVRLISTRDGRGRALRARAGESPTGLAFSSDGRLVVVSYRDGVAEVRRTATGGLVKSVGPAHKPSVQRPYALFTADTRRVVVIDRDVRVADLSGPDAQTLGAGRARRDRRGLMPAGATEGSRLATAFDGAVPYVWDLRRPGRYQELRESSRRVSGIAFSRDGHVLATAGQEGVRLWDAVLALPLATLTARPFDSVSFSADGRSVLASGAKVGAQVFPCRPCGSSGELLAVAEQLTDRVHPLVPLAPLPAARRDVKLRRPKHKVAAVAPSRSTSSPVARLRSQDVVAPPPTSMPLLPPTATATAQPQPEPQVQSRGRFRTKGQFSDGTVQG